MKLKMFRTATYSKVRTLEDMQKELAINPINPAIAFARHECDVTTLQQIEQDLGIKKFNVFFKDKKICQLEKVGNEWKLSEEVRLFTPQGIVKCSK
jgi:GTP cyclohydrolase II